jgi:hypothetical protein
MVEIYKFQMLEIVVDYYFQGNLIDNNENKINNQLMMIVTMYFDTNRNLDLRMIYQILFLN